MSKIDKIKSHQVFDSRGLPTIETEIYLFNGIKGSAIVPSGASTGTYEAFELRDIENKKYLGKSVLKAVEKINNEISKTLKGFSIHDQEKIGFSPKISLLLIGSLLFLISDIYISRDRWFHHLFFPSYPCADGPKAR